jgi:hypothetical protein
MHLCQLGQTDLVTPHEKVICCHYFHVLLALKLWQHMDYAFIAECIGNAHPLLNKTLSESHENLLCYVQHLLLGNFLLVLRFLLLRRLLLWSILGLGVIEVIRFIVR